MKCAACPVASSAIICSLIGAIDAALAGDLRRHALQSLLAARLSTSRLNSDWPSMSMKPGETTRFVASIARAGRGARQVADRRQCDRR